MALAYDPEVAAAMAPLVEARGDRPLAERGDWQTRRAEADELLPLLFGQLPAHEGVTTVEHETTAADGATIPLRWFEPSERSGTAAVLYLHGGGMIFGSVDGYHGAIASYVGRSGVPMLAVDYRLAPEHPHPTPVEDCYAGLTWLAGELAGLGVERLAVMGDSAGGALAAAVVRLARERGGPEIVRQLLIYPMLDDRTASDPALDGLATWSYDDNATGWTALLGAAAGGPDTPWAAAPGRATSPADLAGLPPAYLDIAELDIFRDETVAYAGALWAAGVSTELHVHPGSSHGYEVYTPGVAVAQRAWADRVRVLRSL